MPHENLVTPAAPSRFDELKAALDAGLISQDTFDAATAGISARLSGTGAVSQGQDAVAVGARGVGRFGGDNNGPINTGLQMTPIGGSQAVHAEAGASVLFFSAPAATSPAVRQSTLKDYLQHIITQNRYLQLQGIRAGGRQVNIELDRIYITLRTTHQRAPRGDVAWLAAERALAPGERQRCEAGLSAADTTQVTVNEALADHKRLVVLGDPGSGKTTLLRYLALLYAQDMAQGSQQVTDKLGLTESGCLPISLALRQLGRYLGEHHPKDDGTEGHTVLLQFLLQALKNERIELPADFFDAWLQGGRAAVLFDGLDEVANPALRQRVSRLVDAFTRAYPDCRYVVASRIVGYTDASQLNEGYATTTVRDFTRDDIGAFLLQWHRLVAISQMGPGETAQGQAANQTRQLLASIDSNDRIRELAINPLMLTVIALIHRDRVKLPDRRAELYQEAVDVLLGKWDEARGVKDALALNGRPFDIGDRRLVLQHLALIMHEQAIKEIDAEPLRAILAQQLGDANSEPREREAAVECFLHVIRERTGLLVARAEGTYAFSHLTFQEYLAALAISGRDDYVDYTLRRTGDEWWREVILLEAGYVSTQSKERTTRLIAAIADAKVEPEPYHNLVLAADCVRDAGASRIVGDLETQLRARLRGELETPAVTGPLASFRTLFSRGISAKAAIRRRIAAAEALGKIGGSQYWTMPYGEPEWAQVREGQFTMGEATEAHGVYLPAFAISRVPITNAQYHLFVQATGHEPPPGWNGRRAPRGKEIHPVVDVSWHDALAYCRWLSEATAKPINLPSEAEWEKAARGADGRAYPWGNWFDAARCNVERFGFGGDTTPVGVFPNGASPYDCLDMAGNVWEWTRSLWGTDRYSAEFAYPYDPADSKREDVTASDEVMRLVRGGSWSDHRDYARCAFRYGLHPHPRFDPIGFRVVLRSAPVS